MPDPNHSLRRKYAKTAWVYDILDYPWERIYRRWRPQLLQDMSGDVIELGVGTGHNLLYYPAEANVLGIDLSEAMLQKAQQRAHKAQCEVHLKQEDASTLSTIDDHQFDWLISTFLCCVMPDSLQPQALRQFARVLKPGGRFRILEIVYSKNPKIRRRQLWLAGIVEKIYGARFDRKTLDYIKDCPQLAISQTRYLKDDTYLLIDGYAR